MYHVYILQSTKTKKLYIGSTYSVEKRITEHNKGLVKSTKAYTPWILIYTESYRLRTMALQREYALKYHGRVLKLLLHRIRDSLS